MDKGGGRGEAGGPVEEELAGPPPTEGDGPSGSKLYTEIIGP
jgi:hypothetical protein